MKRLLLLLLGGLFMVFPSSAQSGDPPGGMSPIWQRRWNDGQLFDPANPAHHPDADPDGDSHSNRQEAIAGTNPFHDEPPDGFLRLTAEPHSPAGNLYFLSWRGLPGKVYELQVSPDLVDWATIDVIPGYGGEILLAIEAAHEDETDPERLFWRVSVQDYGHDSDGDGRIDSDEYFLGIDPHNFDTDGDGIPDGLDQDPLNPDSQAQTASSLVVWTPLEN